jgi:hypothetical protein
MKKIQQIIITFIGLITLTLSINTVHAKDLCFIKWQGDRNNSCAVTSETSRTQQATYELYGYLAEQDDQISWDGSCYSWSRSFVDEFILESSGTACIDGTWDNQYYVCSDCNSDTPIGGCFCYEIVNGGTWNVICGTDSDFDCDSDDIPDEDDDCPFENPYGGDANVDGCYDRLEDLPTILQGLDIKNHGTMRKLISFVITAQEYIDEGDISASGREIESFKSLIGKKVGKSSKHR